ncbi:MAG: 8-oxoguanine glycosylase domain protein [Verrucomicrobiales bacterium]|nr:8-oxoguanine glycosylase domain protein [Verrucomicrobiales bacterium]
MRFHAVFSVSDYDLGATLSSGQAFRWDLRDGWWEGVVAKRWVRLQNLGGAIVAEMVEPVSDWDWLKDYLQLEIDLASIVETFPQDEPMRLSAASCTGLRLLRQEPWECLASFILSSTKQIVQIRQIVAMLCERFGQPIPAPSGRQPAYGFPSFGQIAEVSEQDLRACKMGFRAPYLRGAARMIANGEIDLEKIRSMPLDEARLELEKLPGVGRKIADCVLLFGYGFQQAFPVDVWVMKALQQLYFPKRRVKLQRLRKFSETHFGPNAGYAQQYLFHYMRVANQPRTTKTAQVQPRTGRK